jgi:hypothetical protein
VERIRILRDATRLKVVHRQRVARQGDAEPAPAFTRDGAPVATIEAAARGWQRLLDTEYESVVIASWMTAALARLGAPLDLLGAFGRVVEDEVRHVDLCCQLVDALGTAPTISRGPLPPLPDALERGSAGELETVSGLVGFFCVFEFLSGLVFHEALETATVDLPRWAIGAWSEEWRTALARRVEDDVRRFEQRLGGPLPAGGGPLDAEIAALELMGLLSPPRLLATFYEGVEGQLVPRLFELGIPVACSVRRPPDDANV